MRRRKFSVFASLDHNNDETLRSLADAYQKLGKPAAAEDAYRKAISLRPNYWGGNSALGAFCYNQDNMLKKRRCLRRQSNSLR